jgi:hypothetical protein
MVRAYHGVVDLEADTLADAMDAVVVFLRARVHEPGDRMAFWADWVSTDSDRVRRGDAYGVKHFLSAFGGMGSINDLWFDAPATEGSSSASAEFERLKKRAWELANAAERDHARGRLRP